MKTPAMPYNINELNVKWRRLGWDVAAPAHEGHVDPEELIIKTTHAGRHDDRLFEWLLTFIREYHDLINTKRILRLLDQADKPVLGAVFDIAMENGAPKNFRTITDKCTPYEEPQILFHELAKYDAMKEQEKKGALPIYLKWGLYCTFLEFYTDATLTREAVLKNNPLLALRAIFGPNIRSEILFCLTQKTGIPILALAQSIGYAYGPVYNEVMSLLKNNLITDLQGRKHTLALSHKTRSILSIA